MAFTVVTSRSSRNTCPLNSLVQHFAQDVQAKPISRMMPASRSTGYSKRRLRSCVSAAMRKGIGVKETGLTSLVQGTCGGTAYCFYPCLRLTGADPWFNCEVYPPAGHVEDRISATVLRSWSVPTNRICIVAQGDLKADRGYGCCRADDEDLLWGTMVCSARDREALFYLHFTSYHRGAGPWRP